MYNTIISEHDTSNNIDLKKFPLPNTGNLFIMFRNSYSSDGILKENFMNIIEKYSKLGFNYVNTIICIDTKNNLIKDIPNKFFYMIWFVKDLNNMYFNKDFIREKHIWKDVEWGKRTKNYNPKGKDPGNVWIPTEDDGKGKITHHIELSLEETLARCIGSTTSYDEKVYIKIASKIDTSKLPDRNYTIEYFKKSKPTDYIYKYNFIKSPKKILENNSHEVFFDTSEHMKHIENDSIDLIVTSPPYWDIKNYFKDGQIGKESYETYLNRLALVWRECYRVLKDTSSMWININIISKNKKPILIPNDIIKQCEQIGFKFRDIVIWHKSSGIPTRDNNIVDRHEYLLWFTKTNNYKFNNSYLSNIDEYKNADINQGDIWNINRKAGTIGKNYIHPAIYPTELIERIINLCTNKGDIVMDPFLGSGTTLIATIKSNRYFKGFEYNEQFAALINHRLELENLYNNNINYYIDDKKIKHSALSSYDSSSIFR